MLKSLQYNISMMKSRIMRLSRKVSSTIKKTWRQSVGRKEIILKLALMWAWTGLIWPRVWQVTVFCESDNAGNFLTS
jgi:hypothetical protein